MSNSLAFTLADWLSSQSVPFAIISDCCSWETSQDGQSTIALCGALLEETNWAQSRMGKIEEMFDALIAASSY